jgi:atypical dual specificity phosphatase
LHEIRDPEIIVADFNESDSVSLAGMSRSVTVAVAYIMSITNLSWKEALKVVRVGRSIANPNVGFQQQLKDFESSRLQDVSKR